MPLSIIAIRRCLAAAAAVGLAAAASAKNEEWIDTQGTKFRGEPSELLGPFAFFRRSSTAGRRILLRQLTPQDCVRFHEQLRTRPNRADNWMQAKGAITSELPGHVLRVEGDKLVSADLSGRPEPEFIILFFASHGVGESWEMMGNANSPFTDLQRKHPGMVEALFCGRDHSKRDHSDMAVSMKVPWLVTDYRDQAKLSATMRFAPERPPAMVVLTREGVPLIATYDHRKEQIAKAMSELAGVLDLMRPENPQSWNDRLYYLRAIQPAVYQAGQCAPLLVGDPLDRAVLQGRSVFQFDATLNISADGIVTGVAIKPGGRIPAELVESVAYALEKAVLVPAVAKGRFVDGVYEYHFEAPR